MFGVKPGVVLNKAATKNRLLLFYVYTWHRRDSQIFVSITGTGTGTGITDIIVYFVAVSCL